jgi:hypothetical protein
MISNFLTGAGPLGKNGGHTRKEEADVKSRVSCHLFELAINLN